MYYHILVVMYSKKWNICSFNFNKAFDDITHCYQICGLFIDPESGGSTRIYVQKMGLSRSPLKHK